MQTSVDPCRASDISSKLNQIRILFDDVLNILGGDLRPTKGGREQIEANHDEARVGASSLHAEITPAGCVVASRHAELGGGGKMDKVAHGDESVGGTDARHESSAECGECVGCSAVGTSMGCACYQCCNASCPGRDSALRFGKFTTWGAGVTTPQSRPSSPQSRASANGYQAHPCTRDSTVLNTCSHSSCSTSASMTPFLRSLPVPKSMTPARRSGQCGAVSLRPSRRGCAFWIFVWPCIGKASLKGKPISLVAHSGDCYLQDVIEKAAHAAQCLPAPIVLYEPHGQIVYSVKQLCPNQHYLMFPRGGSYRSELVPSALLKELVRSANVVLKKRYLDIYDNKL
ncbi:hypothetical protein ERJ75_001824900 [Trypanosoma vivax]|nr:hypothetical protein ERJ75_001824900 [Trypanosoma vivax]